MTPYETAVSVIRRESEALAELVRELDDRINGAVAGVRSADYVVTAGLGKSGHIARKVAATFAGLGIPSFYLHVAEAMHGDLGALKRGALLLVFSKSGRTDECLVVARRARNIGMPVVSICEDRSSALAELSDIALTIPKLPEACLKAPTVSALMQLALGDALAVATADQMTEREFQALHPGGAIGQVVNS